MNCDYSSASSDDEEICYPMQPSAIRGHALAHFGERDLPPSGLTRLSHCSLDARLSLIVRGRDEERVWYTLFAHARNFVSIVYPGLNNKRISIQKGVCQNTKISLIIRNPRCV